MATIANAAGLEQCLFQGDLGFKQQGIMWNQTPEEYWSRAAFVRFLDHVIKEFEDQFSQLIENSIRGLKVIPNAVTSLSAEDEDVIIPYFKDDLPFPVHYSGSKKVETILGRSI